MALNKLRSAKNYSEKMKCNMLPTDWNVISHFHYVREKMMMEDARFVNNKFPTFNEVKSEVINNIKTIWSSSSLPYVSDKRIEERLKSLLDVFKKEKRKASKTGADVESASFSNLFDICTCKCELTGIETKDKNEKVSCKCPKERRIPCQGMVAITLILCLG